VNGEGGGGQMYFMYVCEEDRALKPDEITSCSREGMRQNDGGDEPRQGTLLSTYGNGHNKPLYSYHMLTKMLKVIYNSVQILNH
jgi:hypothetical protein